MRLQPSQTTAVHLCPHCGATHDRAAAVGGDGPRQPSPGSIMLCVNCGEWMVHTGGIPRQPTEEERGEIATSFEACAVRAAWLEMCRRNGGKTPGEIAKDRQ